MYLSLLCSCTSLFLSRDRLHFLGLSYSGFKTGVRSIATSYLNVLASDGSCVTMNTVASRGWILPGLSLLPVFRRGHNYLATGVFSSPQVVRLVIIVRVTLLFCGCTIPILVSGLCTWVFEHTGMGGCSHRLDGFELCGLVDLAVNKD